MIAGSLPIEKDMRLRMVFEFEGGPVEIDFGEQPAAEHARIMPLMQKLLLGDPSVTFEYEGLPRQTRPEREGREGDSQGMPTVNDSPFVQDAVIANIEERKALGIRRYGTALQPHNGRDALLDAYEEAMDLCIYLKQALLERDHPREEG